MKIHAALLSLPTRARRDHKIMCSFGYRLDQLAHDFGVIAAVAVEEHDNLATWRNCPKTRAKGAAIATVGFVNDARAGGARHFRRAVGAAIIDDDNFVGDVPRNGTNHLSNRILLVQRGYDHRHKCLRIVRIDLFSHVSSGSCAFNRWHLDAQFRATLPK